MVNLEKCENEDAAKCLGAGNGGPGFRKFDFSFLAIENHTGFVVFVSHDML